MFKCKCQYYSPDKCLGRQGEINCCTSKNPCNEGEGDCDRDSHCAEGLVCGKDNCRNFTKEAKANSDCCVKKGYINVELARSRLQCSNSNFSSVI